MITIILLSVCIILAVSCLYLWKNNAFLKLQIENEKQLSRSQEQLRIDFSNISNEILLRNHNNFINIAKDTFENIINSEKIEQNKKQNEFIGIIKPIRETLNIFDEKISQIEKERIDAYSDLRRQMKDLMLYQQEIQKETNSLARALSTPFISGQWGEMQLRRVVEITGMIPHCDFTEQEQSDSSRLRPDMIIKLPGGRNIIVDAKAPLDTYMKAVNTGDDTLLEAHAKRIKNHIKILGQKNYWEQFFPTPEFVIMFLPGESFFSAAIKKDASLIEYGVGEKVIIATPITLIALLKAISFSWQQEAVAKNAMLIGEAGKTVCSYLDKLFEFSNTFEKKLIKNAEEYQKINNFIEKNLEPAALKLKNLGINADLPDNQQN